MFQSVFIIILQTTFFNFSRILKDIEGIRALLRSHNAQTDVKRFGLQVLWRKEYLNILNDRRGFFAGLQEKMIRYANLFDLLYRLIQVGK